MKTRMRRFWISVSLVGSLALPLSSPLRAHDLPTRWTSGANSTPSWNHLLDDCLDTPSMAGPDSLAAIDMTTRRAPADWASSCPAESAAGVPISRSNNVAHARAGDHDHLWRNPISRFSKEMTCWVNEWQEMQREEVAPAPETRPYAWAARPSAGDPPTPDWNAFIRSNMLALHDQAAAVAVVPQSDTCAFDAEFQARRTAADLLAAEMHRAAEIARAEQQLSQALVDAARVQAISDMDALDTFVQNAKADNASTLPIAEVASSAAFDRFASTLCGGESNEILSINCFPNRFAPGIVDEYMAYDLDPRDQHWLGGLGKAWKLRTALSNSRAMFLADKAELNDDIWAIPTGEPMIAPESFVAPDFTNSPDAVVNSALDTTAMSAYLDRIVNQAQRSVLSLLDDARQSAQPAVEVVSTVTPTVLPTLLPDLRENLARINSWIESQQCAIAAELCGFEQTYALGRQLGGSAIESTQFGFSSLIAMGHYLDVPATGTEEVTEPGMDVYVIYIDADGARIAVPSSMARAWNRPEREVVEPVAEPAETTSWSMLDGVQSQVLTLVAKRLDSIGMTCLQLADSLNSWAQTEIASRGSVEIR